MDIKRHIIIEAVKTKENELIPIWDDRIIFEKTEMYGNLIRLKGDRTYNNHFNVVECIYDLKTKKVEIGVELNDYPDENNLDFKKGQIVLFEKSSRNLAEARISDVVYEEFEMTIKRGRKLEKYEVAKFKDVEIEGDTLYAIKRWKPFFVLDNGIKIQYTHQLYHKYIK